MPGEPLTAISQTATTQTIRDSEAGRITRWPHSAIHSVASPKAAAPISTEAAT